MQITPWFGDSAVEVQSLGQTDRVAYSWGTPAGADPETHTPTISDLLVWHDCDQSIGTSEGYADRAGWVPWGCGLHTLINVSPLHIVASVYYPDCCGLHGFITNGEWTDA
jgi:hypothetical protein